MSGNANRLQWVDTAKGLSIILVVMMHSAYGVGEETGGTGVLHWIIGFATPFRMPEFFLISGLFLSQVIGRDWLRFADRRVVHYFYFYALWAFIQIIFKVALGAGDPATAASYLAWAVIEPYGVLWFIYMLAVFSAATKLLHQLKVPHWAVLVVAAGLQMAHIISISYIVTEFTAYFVYFYAGYALAPQMFKLIAWVDANPGKAVAGLVVWAVVNGLLVFSPGFEVLPKETIMGLGGLPGIRLALALIGTVALCTIAMLCTKLAFMDWLRWLGAHSIVVYLSFSIPMAMTRVILLKLGVITNTSVLSVIVWLVALTAPLVLYALIQKTGYGKFLFERPAWAHLPGVPGGRQKRVDAVKAPAE
jgi:uncharacterized membrane protein YcfT